MYEPSFLKRLASLGVDGLVKSLDFITGLAVTLVFFYIYRGGFPAEESEAILNTFVSVSGTLFAIILTGLAIVLSFSDPAFIYAWKEEVEGFEDIVTTFQFNLYLPILVLSFSLILQYVQYNGTAMVLLIGFFSYMLASLVDIVNFLARYGLQRAEFISQQMDAEGRSAETISDEELRELLIELKKTEAKLEEKERD